MNMDGSDQHMVSTGKGRTTCSYFYPDGKKILYASTHLASAECPPRPDFSKGYVWAVYSGYDIFTANPDGSDLKQLTNTPGYDAEATISLDGKKIVFTSMRNGDLDIYSMDADGKHVKQLTHELGYDGGPFSPDRKMDRLSRLPSEDRERNLRLQGIAGAEPDSSENDPDDHGAEPRPVHRRPRCPPAPARVDHNHEHEEGQPEHGHRNAEDVRLRAGRDLDAVDSGVLRAREGGGLREVLVGQVDGVDQPEHRHDHGRERDAAA